MGMNGSGRNGQNGSLETERILALYKRKRIAAEEGNGNGKFHSNVASLIVVLVYSILDPKWGASSNTKPRNCPQIVVKAGPFRTVNKFYQPRRRLAQTRSGMNRELIDPVRPMMIVAKT